MRGVLQRSSWVFPFKDLRFHLTQHLYRTYTKPVNSKVSRVVDQVVDRAKTLAGMERAAALGRHPGRPVRVADAKILAAIPLGTAAGARKVGLSKSQFIARRKRLEISREPMGDYRIIGNQHGSE